MRSRKTLTIFSMALIFASMSLFLCTKKTKAVTSGLLFAPQQKGICYVTWDKESFSSEIADKALEKLSELGVTHLQINVTWYQDRYNSTAIKQTDRTPSDSSLAHAIEYSKKLGLKVMLKPHIDLIHKEDGSYWRADIGFNNDEDWDKWFASYKKMITHYAEIAEKKDVGIFCIGTELAFTTQKTEHWKEVIHAVKKEYSGELVYAANWDNYKNIKFWDQLDYVGINAYFPLTYESTPALEDLVSGWNKWIQQIESWLYDKNMPVIFTEIGYASTASAPAKPWASGNTGNADVEAQAKCYTAFFKAVWNRPWLKGVYWWRWAPTIYGGGKNNRTFTPLNKPAEIIIKKHYLSRQESSYENARSLEISKREVMNR